MTERETFTKSDLFQRAVRRILRPLVRALIAQGVTAPVFYQIVKHAYVEEAANALGTKASDSRISVATGIHRRDVKALRAETETDLAAAGRKLSTMATVISRWLVDPQYLDTAGQPKRLPRTAESGASFESLVQGISRDIRPRAVLDELLRQEIVSLDGEAICLRTDTVFGPADLDQKLHFFSHNLGDHMSAAVENLLAETSPFYERALFYNNLTQASVETLEAASRDRSTDTLAALNAEAARLQSQDQGKAEANHRIRVGVYIYREDEGAPQNGTKTEQDKSKS